MSDSNRHFSAPQSMKPTMADASASGRGVEHPGVIDAMIHDPATDEVVLIMVEPRPWDGTEIRLFQLQEKMNAYLSFALDGEMAEAYPALEGKALRIQLDCATFPDSMTINLLKLIRDQISFQGIDLQVRVPEESGVRNGGVDGAVDGGDCGSGCGCGR